jgi:hypothetical protein
MPLAGPPKFVVAAVLLVLVVGVSRANEYFPEGVHLRTFRQNTSPPLTLIPARPWPDALSHCATAARFRSLFPPSPPLLTSFQGPHV